jgi:hypothetical protein
MTTTKLHEVLAALHMAPEYYPVLERLLECAGARASDVAQTFFCELLAARESGLPHAEALALAAARRWLRRQRLDDGLLEPLTLEGDDGRERERPLRPLPMPAPQVRRQIRWGRRSDAKSAPPPPPPNGDLAAAVRALPTPERLAIQACYGITGPKRRGRRSRELRALEERAVERLRDVLAREHVAAKML